MNCGCQNGLEIARFLFEAVLKYGHAASEGNGVDAVAKPAQASRETRLIEARNCVLVSLFVQGDEDKESGGRSGTSHYSTLFALPPPTSASVSPNKDQIFHRLWSDLECKIPQT